MQHRQWPLAVLLLAAAAARPARCGQYGFSVHDDLLAFPQFQVVFPDSYIREEDARSRLEIVSESSHSSAKASHQTPSTPSAAAGSDNVPSIYKQPSGEATSGDGGDASSSDFTAVPRIYEYMVFDSRPYLCSIPQLSQEDLNDNSTKKDPEEEGREISRARKRGSELIAGMEGPCLYYISGWWSYSFCYNEEVKQFHHLPPDKAGALPFPPVEDKAVPSYVLGRYDPSKFLPADMHPSRSGELYDSEADAYHEQQHRATDLVEVQSQGNVRYLVQKLDDGNICDLTGRPRRIEIQYHCAPGSSDKIGSIKEISTCSYRMVVYTSRLCDDIAFQPPRESPSHKIICEEIVPESEELDWQARREIKSGASKTMENLVGQAGSETTAKPDVSKAGGKPRFTIGGIELGGMKTVGQPGKRIEPPRHFILPPPPLKKSKNDEGGEIIVRYDPKEPNKYWRMSDKRLNSLDIEDDGIAKIDDMAQEMMRSTPDKRWKIVMTDGDEPGVRILDAVIMEDDIDLDAQRAKEHPKTQQADGQKDNQADDKTLRDEEEGADSQGSEEEFFARDEL